MKTFPSKMVIGDLIFCFTKETSDNKMVLVWVYSQLTPIDTKCTKY